jgi:hypothetical protein
LAGHTAMRHKRGFMAGSPDSGLVYPHKVGLTSHIRNGNWVCAMLGERAWSMPPRGITRMKALVTM